VHIEVEQVSNEGKGDFLEPVLQVILVKIITSTNESGEVNWHTARYLGAQ